MFKDGSFTGREIYIKVSDILEPIWEQEASALSKLLLTEVLDLKWIELVSSSSIELDKDKASELECMIERLLKMEPIQYILGYTYFLGRKFNVSPEVLIPRQETEELVQAIINVYTFQNPKILDIGGGSGCIGISLALELNVKSFTAIDKSSSALKVAKSNARRFDIEMTGINLDILKDEIPLSGYDLIVSNPPYVRPSEKELMKRNVLDYEPMEALFVPEDDPLIFYKKIIQDSADILRPKGMLFFEVNEVFGEEVKRLLIDSNFIDVRLSQDIHGKDRFVYGMN